MKRIFSVVMVLGLMAAMLVAMSVPAFAVAGAPGAPSLGESDPDGPPPNEESGGPSGTDVDPQAAEAPQVDEAADEADVDTLGDIASEIVVDDATVHGAPPGYHILKDVEHTPGECAQDPTVCFQ